MTTDFQTCLDLSYAVYGGSNASKIPDYWKQIDLDISIDGYYKNTDTGFVGAVYGLDTNNDGVYEQIVISYRGTERNGLGEKGGNNLPLTPDTLDMANDLQIVGGASS